MEAEGGLKWALVYFELGYEHGFQGRRYCSKVECVVTITVATDQKLQPC
jgi:hypothetical protein